MNMRRRLSTIITLTITLTLLFLGVPVIALAAPVPTPASLTLNPTSIVGGTGVTGQVSLTGPAPEGGRGVLLSSSNTAVATVPASVRVPAGQTTVSFAVTTIPVAQSSPVTISAGSAGQHDAALTVVPPVLSSFTSGPDSITGGGPIMKAYLKAYLSGPAPSGGFVINLSSSNTAVATVRESIPVPPGQTSAGISVTTVPVAQSTPVTITATAGGVTKTAQFNVVPLLVGLSTVSVSPTSIVGGTGVTGQVSLNGPAPSGGFVINLSSSNTAVATVPASVIVAANSTTANFTVTTFQIAPPTASTTITATAGGGTKTAVASRPFQTHGPAITATAGGGTKTAQLTILRPPPPKLSQKCAACEKMCEVAGDAEKKPGAVAGCKANCKKTCQ